MTLYDCLVELHGVEKSLSFPFDGLVVKTNEFTNSVGSVTFVIIAMHPSYVALVSTGREGLMSGITLL